MIEDFTTAELAALLGCTPRHLQQLAKDGIIPKAARGRWPAAAVTAYCRHLQSDARRGPADFQAERARLTRAQADAQEMKNALQSGELVPTSQVVRAVSAVIGACRSRLLGIPAKAAPLLVGVETPHEVRSILCALVREACAELAQKRLDDELGIAPADEDA